MKKLIWLATAATLFAAPAHADSWKTLKDAAKQQASQKVEETLDLAQPAKPGTRVYLVTPENGAEVSSPVHVVFGLSQMGIAPAGVNQEGTGHHHLLIDNPEVDMSRPLPATSQIVHFGGGQTETLLELSPGEHTLQLLLGDWKHQPHTPPVQSETITITVK